MTPSYDLALVALSLIIAFFSSLAALGLVGHVPFVERQRKNYWLTGSAIAMGSGVWAMHFMGMLAFHLPIPLAYDFTITLLSLLVAILSAYVALRMVRDGIAQRRELMFSALLLALGICTMHYVGMAALRISPPIVYHKGLVALSFLIAYLASLFALRIALNKVVEPRLLTMKNLYGAAFLGMAIAGMHYVGMYAANFSADSLCLALGSGLVGQQLVWSVGLVTLTVLLITFMALFYDLRERDRHDLEERSRQVVVETLRNTVNSLLRSLGHGGIQEQTTGAGLEQLSKIVESLALERNTLLHDLELQKFALDQHAIVSITDLQGNITYANDRFCATSGYSRSELLGKNHRILKSGVHDAAYYDEFWSTIASGKVWQGEMCNRAKGGEYYWVYATVVPHLDEQGVPKNYIAIRTEITEKKQLEEQRLKSLNAMKGALLIASNTQWGLADKVDAFLQLGVRSFDAKLAVVGVLEEGDYRIEYASGEQAALQTTRCFATETHPCAESVSSDYARLFHPADAQHCFPREFVEALPFDAYLGATLFLDGKIYGSIGFFQPQLAEASAENELMLLRLFAQLISAEISRDRAMQRVEDARTSAEQASNAKTEFLSSMSHELRTPLNAVMGFAQLLQMDRESLNGEQYDSVRQILKASQHLLALINDVLDLAKIEAGKMEVSTEQILLQRVFDESHTLILPLAQAKGVSLQFEQPGRLYATGDYTRLKQVLLNLLSNAIKYNHPGGQVTVTVQPSENDRVRIEVVDTGSGIPVEEQQRLFQPFERIGVNNGEIEGTGIGLVICRKLMELMEGEVGMQSTPGVGSTFWLELASAGTAVQEGTAEERAAPATDDTGRATGQYRILYIEDNPMNLALVERLLARYPDYQLLSAVEPKLGLELARLHLPDLILLDINLPDFDGFEVLRRLREEPATSAIPVVAISANAMPMDIERGNAAGFDDYLAKPLDMSKLLQTIESYRAALAGG